MTTDRLLKAVCYYGLVSAQQQLNSEQEAIQALLEAVLEMRTHIMSQKTSNSAE